MALFGHARYTIISSYPAFSPEHAVLALKWGGVAGPCRWTLQEEQELMGRTWLLAIYALRSPFYDDVTK